MSESVFQIWLNPSNFPHIHYINTWKGGCVTALVVKRIRRDLNVSHQMHVLAIYIPRRWSDYRGYPTPSFLRPGFVLSVPAGNFAPQLKIGETKSKLGQIRSGPSNHWWWSLYCIDSIEYNRNIENGLSIPKRSGCKLPANLKIIVVVVICSLVCQKSWSCWVTKSFNNRPLLTKRIEPWSD